MPYNVVSSPPYLFPLYTNDCISSHTSIKLVQLAHDTTVLGLIKDDNETSYRVHACNDLVASGRDRKPNAVVQVAVIDPHKQQLVSHASTEIVE
ncbi:unnamed protein product, partial [Menidia menidia]